MSTPTGKSPNEEPYPPTQHTPVIIKTGDDGVPGSSGVPVEIESPMMDFIESEPGPTWVSAHSALAGRLTELSVEDGTKGPEDYKILPNELATIVIQYGSVQIRIWESVVPTSNDVIVLNIESEIPFNVTKSGKWRKAQATFPPISRVVFTAGNKTIVNRKFKVANPTINVNFDRTKFPVD